MKGKIDVVCVISKDFSGEYKVSTKAILKDKKASNVFGKGYGNLQIKIRHDFSFDMLQAIAAEKGLLDHLEDKGGFVLYGLDADFVYAKAKNTDNYYHVIFVNFGTEANPMIRSFYINKHQEITLSKFDLEYPFTSAEVDVDAVDALESADLE